MNTLTKSMNHLQPGADVPSTPALSVQRVCLLLLGSAAVFSAHGAPTSNLGQVAGSSQVLLAQAVIKHDPWAGGPPQGDGIFVAPAPPPPPPRQPVISPPLPPAASAPVKPPVTPVTAPASIASVNSVLPAPVDPVKPPQGNQPTELPPRGGGGGVGQPVGGSGPTLSSNSAPFANGTNIFRPPVRQGASQGARGLGEILPGAQKLGESMQEQTASAKDTYTNIVATNAKTKCTAVSLRPDARRQAVSLVDLLGDGLIVAAVPDVHIQSVFSRAGYDSVDLSKATRWCITPMAARELLQPASGTGGQDAALLVQTGGGLQLMSQDQWLAHQASLKPSVTAMTPAKPAKSGKTTKVAGRALSKTTAKSATGITVGALRLPVGPSKATGTAS